MSKSVYSVVLMDDVVSAIDAIAYTEGTSRSNMINRILAQYASMSTPEQRMGEIFGAISNVIHRQDILQPMLSTSDAMLNLRSALQYKYNPSVRYVVELYRHPTIECGEMRVSLRTQNPALLLAMMQFYKLWAKLETSCLYGAERQFEFADGKYVRHFQIPKSKATSHELGSAIADYVALFDACLKVYFENLNNAELAIKAVEKVYKTNLDTHSAQL